MDIFSGKENTARRFSIVQFLQFKKMRGGKRIKYCDARNSLLTCCGLFEAGQVAGTGPFSGQCGNLETETCSRGKAE